MPDLMIAPAFCTHPHYATTLGPEASDFGRSIGFGPDPEQELCLDLMYGTNGGSTWSAFEFCVICSRQNLKTGLFKIAGLFDLFCLHDKLVTWTAHLFDTTEGAFRDIKNLIDGSDMLTRRVHKITEGNGDEEIITTDGCHLQFKARGKKGGRGKTGAKPFLDEGLFLERAHVGSLYPTTATLPGAQIRIGSSAGVASSAVLRDIRDRGRKGGDPDLAYVEWSDQKPRECEVDGCDHHRDRPGCCLDDRDRWRTSNPAMGRRISEQRIASFRRSMPPEEFAREFLGWWEEPEQATGLDFSNWPELADRDSQIVGTGTYGVAVSPDRDRAAISVSGTRADGLQHIDVGHHRAGTSWVVRTCVLIDERYPGARFVVDGGGPASTLIPAMEQEGLDVKVIGLHECAQACSLVLDGVKDMSLRHRDQAEMNDAVTSAKARTVGDGLILFGRRASGGDITPLEAGAFALYGHTNIEERGPVLW